MEAGNSKLQRNTRTNIYSQTSSYTSMASQLLRRLSIVRLRIISRVVPLRCTICSPHVLVVLVVLVESYKLLMFSTSTVLTLIHFRTKLRWMTCSLQSTKPTISEHETLQDHCLLECDNAGTTGQPVVVILKASQ